MSASPSEHHLSLRSKGDVYIDVREIAGVNWDPQEEEYRLRIPVPATSGDVPVVAAQEGVELRTEDGQQYLAGEFKSPSTVHSVVSVLRLQTSPVDADGEAMTPRQGNSER